MKLYDAINAETTVQLNGTTSMLVVRGTKKEIEQTGWGLYALKATGRREKRVQDEFEPNFVAVPFSDETIEKWFAYGRELGYSQDDIYKILKKEKMLCVAIFWTRPEYMHQWFVNRWLVKHGQKHNPRKTHGKDAEVTTDKHAHVYANLMMERLYQDAEFYMSLRTKKETVYGPSPCEQYGTGDTNAERPDDSHKDTCWKESEKEGRQEKSDAVA